MNDLLLSYTNSCWSHSQSSSIIVTGASAAVEFTRTAGSEVLRDTVKSSADSSTLSSTVEMLTHTGWLGADGSIVHCCSITGVKPPATAVENKTRCASRLSCVFADCVEQYPEEQSTRSWFVISMAVLIQTISLTARCYSNIPEVEKKTVTLLSSCPLCSCAQTITVSPSVTTYAGCVSPTTTSAGINYPWDNSTMLAMLKYSVCAIQIAL